MLTKRIPAADYVQIVGYEAVRAPARFQLPSSSPSQLAGLTLYHSFLLLSDFYADFGGPAVELELTLF